MSSTHSLRASKLFDVSNQVAVVTGGGTGIGLMCTQALAANGAKVYITGRREDRLEQSAKTHNPGDGEGWGEIIPIQCDVTSKESLEELVKKVEEKEDHVDILICNAGISGPTGSPDESDAASLKSKLWESESFSAWSDVFTTNVSAVYFTTVAFLHLLQRSPSGGNVITTSSISGLTKSAQSHFAYNSSKGACIQLTKLMANEFAKTGIRVNSIAPGYFPSEMTTGGKSEEESGKSQKFMAKEGWQDEKGVPAGRPGSDEDMAMTVLFLAKNGYVNGEVVVVDGGVLLTLGKR